MNENDFYAQRNNKNLEKISLLLDELPYFCREFFLGIENTTSPLSRLNYAYDLRIFFDYLVKKIFKKKQIIDISLSDLELISDTDIELYLSYLAHYTFNGKNLNCNERAKARKLSTIRAMYKFLFKKNKIKTNNTTKVAVPKLHDKEIIRLEVNEVSSLLDEAEFGAGLSGNQKAWHEQTRIRDVAILTLFLGTGIRISELVGLNNDDIDFTTNAFKVTRKGGNKTILYFSDEVAEALAQYIAQKEELKLKNKIPFNEPALFLSKQNKRICIRAVENLVKKYSKIVTPLKNISPHKLRSTYGTQLYRESKDIYIVADVLGHRDVNTTKKHYAAISDDIRRDAAAKVKLREN